MMHYAVSNPDSFERKSNYIYCFSLATLKLFGAFMTEAINMYKMGQASSVDDVVKDFIAFGVIAEIDDLMVETINSNLDIE